MEHQQSLALKKNSQMEGLFAVMEVIIEVYNAEYDLGIITRGHFVKYNTERDEYEFNYVEYTAIRADVTNRPVIWIYNDNAELRGYHHMQGRVNISHWEGLRDPTRKKKGQRIL
jgi:hypothetical protein